MLAILYIDSMRKGSGKVREEGFDLTVGRCISIDILSNLCDRSGVSPRSRSRARKSTEHPQTVCYDELIFYIHGLFKLQYIHNLYNDYSDISTFGIYKITLGIFNKHRFSFVLSNRQHPSIPFYSSSFPVSSCLFFSHPPEISFARRRSFPLADCLSSPSFSSRFRNASRPLSHRRLLCGAFFVHLRVCSGSCALPQDGSVRLLRAGRGDVGSRRILGG